MHGVMIILVLRSRRRQVQCIDAMVRLVFRSEFLKFSNTKIKLKSDVSILKSCDMLILQRNDFLKMFH